MHLKETFSTIPEEYDKNRLRYPAKVFSTIRQYVPLFPTDKVLEIGIGTGIATPHFARRGNPITAIDISPELMRVAKKKLRGSKSSIKYTTNTFEQAHLPANTFRLAFAAQAFHWVDQSAGLKKLHSLLNDDGALAFFWNIHDKSKPGPGLDTFKLYKKYKMVGPRKHSHTHVVAGVQKSSLFKDVKTVDIHWVAHYSKKRRIQLISTYSAAVALPKNKYKAYIKDTEKQLEKYSSPLAVPIITKMVLARKK